MKLITKYNLINVFFGSILLATGGYFFYIMFVHATNMEINEKLMDNKERIVHLIEEDKPVGSIYPIIEIEKWSNDQVPDKPLIRDTVLLDPVSNDRELFREITSVEQINGQTYRITMRQVIFETHDYLENVGSGIMVMWLIINVGLLVLTLIASSKLWSPFRRNIDKLKKFKVTDQSPIEFQKTTTKEFIELNQVMLDLTEKVRNDYRILKEFSENAAHEIQTPLMIIQTKLEDALQYPGLDPEVGEKIHASLASSHRLAKLVQTLLFIAKIENNQFDKKEEVDLSQCIKAELLQLDDFIQDRKIQVTTRLDQVIQLIDPLLAEVLVSNLLTNAIKHNINNGNIEITLDAKGLSIANSSDSTINHPESMFERFSKASQASNSHGLGLAIVKKICDQNGWKISYSVLDKRHTIEILF